MKILSVLDPAFQNYGQVLTGYDCKALLETLEAVTPLPAGVEYVPQQPELMAAAGGKGLASGAYGGMPIQLGWCNGHNTKLNCLEYHRDSELNLGARDFILLVAKRGGYGGRPPGYRQGPGVPLPGRGPGGDLRHHPALCPLLCPQGGGVRVLIVLPFGNQRSQADDGPQE